MLEVIELTQKEPQTAINSPAILPLKYNQENLEKIEPVGITTSSQIKESTIENKEEELSKKKPISRSTEINSTIFGATFMLTNICLGIFDPKVSTTLELKNQPFLEQHL